MGQGDTDVLMWATFHGLRSKVPGGQGDTDVLCGQMVIKHEGADF
jgi:hypothetical protein